MSDTLLDDGPLGVGTYAGPVRDDGGSRKRWQFTVMDGGDTANLTRDQVVVVMLTLAASLGWWCEPRPPDA